MNKQEFEHLINDTVTDVQFRLIDETSTYFSFLFPTKEDVVYFYFVHGITGFARLNAELLSIKEMAHELDESESNYYYFRDSARFWRELYIDSIKSGVKADEQ